MCIWKKIKTLAIQKKLQAKIKGEITQRNSNRQNYNQKIVNPPTVSKRKG